MFQRNSFDDFKYQTIINHYIYITFASVIDPMFIDK